MVSYTLQILPDEENHFWRQRTRLEKKFILSIVILILITLCLLIRLIVVTNLSNNNNLLSNDSLICESEECLIAAYEIQTSLDKSVDPCDDFYQYACGGWLKNNPIPEDRSVWSKFYIPSKKLSENVRVIMESDFNDTYPPIIQKTLGLYKQCMNFTKRDLDGIEELKNIVTGIGWPMISKDYLPPDYEWAKVHAKLNREHGFNIIISNYVSFDAKNTTIYSIHVDKPSFGLSREKLIAPNNALNKKIFGAYKTYIYETVKYLSGETYPSLEKDIDSIIDFEGRLANITAGYDIRRNIMKLYGNKTNLSEFNENYHGLPNLIDFEKQVFKGIANISGGTPLIVYDKSYFEKLGAQLAKTDNKTIANYIGWRTALGFSGYTTKKMIDIRFEMQKVLSGVKKLKPFWEYCVNNVNELLGFAVGRLYVDKHFTSKAKKDINQMIKQLNIAFRQSLEGQNDWMERETQEKAFNKLDQMLRFIGFPDMIINNTLLEQYYSDYNFNDSNSYMKSISKIDRFLIKKSLKKLNTFNNRNESEWPIGPAIVNAFFMPFMNGIVFPAGILHPPFYDLGRPVSMNLGAIGYAIGHEITHSFDSGGSQYDEYGNLFNWWDGSTKEKFTKKVQCFKDQYSSYNDSFAGRAVNGVLTVNENIADNGGLRQAFRALENYRGVKQLLPASMKSFTNEQLFFISFANAWCENIRKETLIDRMESDPHSPGKYRVLGTLSNLDSFSKAFNCKTDSKMNPKTKCILW